VRRAAGVAAGGAAALVALAALVPIGRASRPTTLPAAAAPASAAPPSPTARGAPPAPALPPLPASLAGTAAGGDLALDARGHFAPGPEALELFDYYFSASGEEPDAVILARIRAEIRRRLPAPAAAEAEALLDRYLAYRDGAAALFAEDLSFADPERRFQRIRELRREVFGPELAAALFGDEEQVVSVDLERRRVALERDLSPGERARHLAALEAELPAAEREARAEARAILELRTAEAELRAEGAGEDAIQAERERRFGPEAAARLAALDGRRAAWSERVASYRAARDALRAAGLAPADEAAALARLRAERFQGPERLRIEALERIEAGGSDGEAVAP
jgi:lipase chaperone LimK